MKILKHGLVFAAAMLCASTAWVMATQSAPAPKPKAATKTHFVKHSVSGQMSANAATPQASMLTGSCRVRVDISDPGGDIDGVQPAEPAEVTIKLDGQGGTASGWQPIATDGKCHMGNGAPPIASPYRVTCSVTGPHASDASGDRTLAADGAPQAYGQRGAAASAQNFSDQYYTLTLITAAQPCLGTKRPRNADNFPNPPPCFKNAGFKAAFTAMLQKWLADKQAALIAERDPAEQRVLSKEIDTLNAIIAATFTTPLCPVEEPKKPTGGYTLPGLHMSPPPCFPTAADRAQFADALQSRLTDLQKNVSETEARLQQAIAAQNGEGIASLQMEISGLQQQIADVDAAMDKTARTKICPEDSHVPVEPLLGIGIGIIGGHHHHDDRDDRKDRKKDKRDDDKPKTPKDQDDDAPHH